MCVIVYTAQYCTYAAHCVPSTRRELHRSECAELRRDPTLSWGQCPRNGGVPVEGPTLPGGAVDMCEACRGPGAGESTETKTETETTTAADKDGSGKE